MKKIICAIAISALFFSCKKENASSKINAENVEEVSNAANNELASIEFNTKEHDFGDLKKGSKAEYEFVITNTGKADLVIYEAKASCGCTIPERPTEPIKPGESSNMKVVFSANSVGKASKTVTVTSNTENTTDKLIIKANVIE